MRTTTATNEIARPKVVSRLRVALGTFVSIDAEAHEPPIARSGLAAAWSAIQTVERVMHPHRDGSDLKALRQSPPGMTVRVHPWTWEVLKLSQELHTASGGVFDPCLDTSPGRLADLELLGPGEVRPYAPVFIDLGGIAKGFAVDRALEALRVAGCVAGLVNAGGDLAAFGKRAHRIRCGQARDAHVWELNDAALATSDANAPGRPAEHRGYYHGVTRIIAATGGATVTAPNAAWADALTKCVMLCDEATTNALLARFNAHVVSSSECRDLKR
jgi:thiamine biosynthesis lipoprotein